uniref:TRASH domain-containing protein n=1 Tax=Xiphophorus couchianus TaxID=32473 RepID=A0A3B5M2I8_9TELE
MGLGEFADSSRGSVGSSKSGGQPESKGLDETLEQAESQPLEEDSNSSRQEKKTDEGTGETSFPPLTSSSSEKLSSFNMVRSERGGGGSGGAAFDDALDGLPSYGPEEEDEEDWHYALPMGSLEDVDVGKASKISQLGQENSASQSNPFDQKPEVEEEEQENEGSTESANTSHSSQDNTPEHDKGENRNPPPSPRVNIKDEPIDEGYDAALLPQNSTKQIKEELEQEVAVPAPTTTHILIPSRGAVLQAVASLPVRPVVSVPTPIPTLTAFPPRPPPPAVPGSVRCSGCAKVLLKGQTAFQRKGSTQLFCSTVCLTGHLPPITKGRACFQCNREILQPRDMVTVPAENSTFMHFCGQFCLSVYRHKKKQVTYQGKLHRLCSDNCFLTWRKQRQLALNCCEGCGLYCSSKSGSCHTLTIEKSQLNFCSSTCIGTFKQVCLVSSTIMERDHKGKVQLYCSPTCVEQSRPPNHSLTGTPFPCGLCKVSAVPQYHLAMVDGTIRSFCSLACVTTFRKSPPTSQPDLTNGTSSLRDLPNKDAPKPGPSTAANGVTGATSVPPIPQDYSSSVPYPGHHPSYTSVPPLVPPHSAVSTPTLPGQAHARSPLEQPVKPLEDGLSDAIALTCYQCSKQFSNKPLLITHQGRILLLCSKSCCDQYNTQKNVLSVCDYCKEEKVLYEVTSFSHQDVFFCSEYCKQFFKQERALRPCSYCCGLGQKMMLSHYGGKIEEFCKPHCMSQYTVLYYGMGRCDSCRKQGYMSEKLQCLGSVCNFCNMACLLQYCCLHFEASQHTSNGMASAPPLPSGSKLFKIKMNPVIADVVSLANGSASTQTDAMRAPAPRRRQMKNKSVLCRPFTMDQEIMCQLPSPSPEPEGNYMKHLSVEENMKVFMVPVPVPVPVFVPVPMNMYSQHTPVAMVVPMPVCGRRRTGSADRSVSGTPASSKLNHLYGVKAWTSWIQQSNKQPTELVFKEDIVQCSSAELGFALTRFIREVRRPNGEPYSPDSIFYLCLGIQQHLFLRGRIENIFTDEVYSQFGSELSRMLQLWKPKLQPSGGIVPSRIEESYLWECKQLGAYSPIVLLNTLLFFCTKHLHLTTLAEHQRLSFSNFTRRYKPQGTAGNVYLQYERNSTGTSGSEQKGGASKKHQVGSNGEMWENAANPLQCPVRLYEFYLSRCPESVKNQSSMFYLRPQRNVHTCSSSSWYSSQPLDASTLQSMLTRILAVREVQQEHERSAAAEGLSQSSV